MQTITVTIKIAWWFKRLYLPGLVASAQLARWMGVTVEPDPDRVNEWLRRAVTYSCPK